MKLGLSSLNVAIVSAYKAMGFVVLGAILLGLFSFIGLNLFFFVNHSWVSPTIVSPGDERVIQAASQLAQQTIAREKLAAERSDLAARLDDANRAVAQQERFQVEFRDVVAAELAARRAELANLERVSSSFRKEKPALDGANEKLRTLARDRLEELRRAQLLTHDEYIDGQQRLEQLDHSRLGLAERDAALANRTAAARRDVSALRAILDTLGSGRPHDLSRRLSYEVLRMQEEYLRSRSELERATANRVVLERTLASVDASLERYDQALAQLKGAPLLRAADGHVTLAFVPYDNVDHAATGTPVYGCRVGVLWCRAVGRIAEQLEGEVSSHHPLRNQTERGRLVRLELTDASSATERVLFAGHAPLLL